MRLILFVAETQVKGRSTGFPVVDDKSPLHSLAGLFGIDAKRPGIRKYKKFSRRWNIVYNRDSLVRAFHFIFDAAGQFLDLFRLLDDVDGEDVFV